MRCLPPHPRLRILRALRSYRHLLVTANARLHLPLEAGATQEQRLEAVRCKALLGWGPSDGLPGGCPPPRNAVTLVRLPETPPILPHPCPAPAYLMTSSACKRTDAGIVRPRAFAVLRLMTNSNCVGCSTG